MLFAQKIQAGEHFIFQFNTGAGYTLLGQIIFAVAMNEEQFFMIDVCRGLDYVLKGNLKGMEAHDGAHFIRKQYDNHKIDMEYDYKERNQAKEILEVHIPIALKRNMNH